MQPGDADAVAQLEVSYAGANGNDHASAFVSGNEWNCWLNRPIAFGCVQISMADTAGNDFNENLARSGARDGNFFNDQRLTELLDNGRMHGFRNGHIRSSEF
jgi:hypothetical protein